MYLSELEIFGFKSFAQKTNFKFTDGISALVGPNGCGKTNIVDAIRWVLGEQKTSVLRSDIMENVIFNGTKSRKPLGLAEVSMIIENNNRVLPLEYSQVRITRRLLRNGESRYMLNNTRCRLRDIYDLFMDTGMGPDSYSVIELKMVEAILSGKVDERRSLFEEAAGITKYKLRRKETSRKLDTVRHDLERVKDLLSEVEKNVNSLQRQAAKTRRYNKLVSQVKELDLKIIKYNYDIKLSETKKADDLIKSLQNEHSKQEKDISELNHTYNALKQDVQKAEKQYSDTLAKAEGLSSDIAETGKEIALLEEKLNNANNMIGRLEGEIESSVAGKKNIHDEIVTKQKLLAEITSKKASLEETAEEVRSAKEYIQNSVSDARAELDRFNEQLINTRTRIQTIKSNEQRLAGRKKNILERIDKEKEQSAQYKKELLQKNEEIKSINAEIQSSSSNLDKLIIKLDKGKNEGKTLKQALRNFRIKADEISSKLNSNNSTITYLENLTDAGSEQKFLLTDKKWEPESGKTLLYEAVSIADDYKAALQAALGLFAKYFVVSSKSEAESAISRLSAENKGKAGFIILDDILEFTGENNLRKEAENKLVSFIEADEPVKKFLSIILADYYLFENLELAENAVKSGKVSVAITPDGSIVNTNGSFYSGSLNANEGKALGKNIRINAVRKENDKLQKELNAIAGNEIEINHKIDSLQLQKLDIEINTVRTGLDAQRQKLASLQLSRESLENKIDFSSGSLKRAQDEIIELEGSTSGEMKELEELKTLQQEIEINFDQSRKQFDNKSEELKISDENLRNAEIDLVKIKSEEQSIEREIKGLESQLLNLDSVDNSRKKELETNNELLIEIGKQKKLLRIRLEELEKESNEVKTRKDMLRDTRESLAEQLEDAERNLNAARQGIDRSREKILSAELEAGENRLLIKTYSQRVKENYQSDIESLEKPDADFNTEEAESEVSSLREKLSGIGNVNFMALEEFEKENERYEFYKQQVADLEQSEITLVETIDEINKTAQRNFRETFEQIRENFKELFITLFGKEGDADISLDEGDPLEADIDIKAKPPGKRPHTIEMLSGGEKTLTAIALLFAIYLVKPSPFCILDEVDAPLDDNNIVKFVSLIRKFSDRTQFLVVTHNKKTMAAADTLYGITMQEEGVSKIVSVRLDITKGQTRA